MHEVAVEASPQRHKKKKAQHRRINILGLTGNDELDKSGNEAKNGDQPASSKQRYHKMMIMKKNQKFVAMVPIDDLKEKMKGLKDNNS